MPFSLFRFLVVKRFMVTCKTHTMSKMYAMYFIENGISLSVLSLSVYYRKRLLPTVIDGDKVKLNCNKSKCRTWVIALLRKKHSIWNTSIQITHGFISSQIAQIMRSYVKTAINAADFFETWLKSPDRTRFFAYTVYNRSQMHLRFVFMLTKLCHVTDQKRKLSLIINSKIKPKITPCSIHG